MAPKGKKKYYTKQHFSKSALPVAKAGDSRREETTQGPNLLYRRTIQFS